ncbi:MAG: hypothetical protein ACYSW8_31330, partial [Planctomycetota bacterium]
MTLQDTDYDSNARRRTADIRWRRRPFTVAVEDRWDEYYRIWRGRWDSSSRSRASERSKLIAPASQIAVDTAAAEILEAAFARDSFIDINDDFKDQEREDAYRVRDQLVE